MSFYKLFGGISGSTESAANNLEASSISGAETIERLCDRVQSASLIEDRRDALIEIKSLSKKYKLEVGTHAMPILIDVLDTFRADSEVCCLALDTLYNVMTTDKSDEMEQKNLPSDITTQFTEMLIKTSSNVNLIFDLLDEFEFQTRWSTLKLLNVLILNQTQSLQDSILEIPRGVSRLMDLLNDSREVIRNDTLLLLNNLIKSNTNIQKIVAFESGFDRIMEIIEGEGSVIDGGVIVEDCFNLLLNLLIMNNSNQNFFKEANYIKMLCKYLDLSSAMNTNNSLTEGLGNELDTNNENIWTAQKVINLNLLLKLIRCLVAPNNQHSIVNDCQKAFSHFGLLHRLCALLTLPGVPAELLSEAISTVGEVIRGNTANQTLFSNVQMQTNPPRPIIVILLIIMNNEKQPFHLRCSIIYCFQCFLYKNEDAKANIVETLLPQEQNVPQQNKISTGQILCNGLFSQNEIFSNWFCAVAVLHTINDNSKLKEQLLRVQLSINLSSDAQSNSVSLMQQCMNILVESTSASQNQNIPNRYRFQTAVSILMLIATWLANCPVAVTYFLSEQQNIPYLISQVSSTDTEDKSLIIQGLSAFLLGLGMLYNMNQVEAYTIEKLRDIIRKRIGIEQFEGKLEFISQHELYTRTLKKPTFAFKCKQANDLLFDYEFTRLYKSNETLILNVLKNKNISGFIMDDQISPSQNGSISSLRDDNEATKANSLPREQEQIVAQYQQIIREQDLKIQTFTQENQDLNQALAQLQLNCKNITAILNEKNSHADNFSSEKIAMQSKINNLENKVNILENKCAQQDDELSKLKRDKGAWEEMKNNIHTDHDSVSENIQLKSTVKELNQEQDNLLTLLQDMELKLKHYKKLLRVCGKGDEISDEEDEGDEDEYNENKDFNHKFDETLKLQQGGVSVSDSIRLNNNATFESLQTEDDYDPYHQPNYIHQIIQSNDYSNNVTPSHTNDNSGRDSNTENSSSHSSGSSHNGENNPAQSENSGFNYPPPTGQNITSLQINPGVKMTENIISQDSSNLTQTPLNKVYINENNNQTTDSNTGAINPFFMQHPFFNKQFQNNSHSSGNENPRNNLQNYFG